MFGRTKSVSASACFTLFATHVGGVGNALRMEFTAVSVSKDILTGVSSLHSEKKGTSKDRKPQHRVVSSEKSCNCAHLASRRPIWALLVEIITVLW